MSIRSVLAASGCVLALTLTGCATTVAGSPQAALPASAVAALDDAAGDLSLPTDAADNPIDPGDLLEGLDGTDGPSLDPSDLGDLLDSLGGADGTGGLGDLGGFVSPECLSVAGQSMALSMLMLAPLMGQALTESDIDQAFSSLADVPPELQSAVDTLHAAAQSAVGASPADASALLSDPAVNDAMDAISQYVDAHCSGE
jgi:hypothetical protein